MDCRTLPTSPMTAYRELRFDRPGFLAMMVKSRLTREFIVISDMSRLGRDYLKVGQVMEILRQRGVRLIAINDGGTV